jgi:hypothetical protein
MRRFSHPEPEARPRPRAPKDRRDRCHADAMQIYFILHGIVSDVQIFLILLGLLARPERWRLSTKKSRSNGHFFAVLPFV